MAENKTYKPVGGVARVALHAADAVVGAQFATEGCAIEFCDEAIEVALRDDGSTLTETTTPDKGIITVSHRLDLVAERNDAEPWLEERFIERATRVGVVAIVTLNDSRSVVLGYSEHLGTEQPLRLHSLTLNAGVTPSDSPTARLSLCSTDASTAAPYFEP